MAYVVVGIPTYDERLPVMVVPALMELAKKHTLHFMPVSASLLAFGHNLCFSNALRVKDADYYINLHNDICPESGGLVKLIELMEKNEAEVMSVISPIKDQRGLTSTGVGDKKDDWTSVKRFTIRQLLDLPATFGQPQVEPGVLMLNTGLLCFSMKAPWIKQVCFTVKDKILWDDDGAPHPVILPEDWGLSHDLFRWGAKTFVTREVSLVHMGKASFPNNIAWGEWYVDQGDNFITKVEKGA